MEIQECQLLRKDWESLVKSVAVVQSELKRVSVMAQDYGNKLTAVEKTCKCLVAEKASLLEENDKLKLQVKKLSANKDKAKFHETVREIRSIEPTNKENIKKKKSSAESISPEPESSQHLFKRKPSSSPIAVIDRSFSKIAENFKEPPTRKKSAPKLSPRPMRQSTLANFSITKNDQSEDMTFCEELEGVKKKKTKTPPWIKRSRTNIEDNAMQLRQTSLEKSFSNLDTSMKSSPDIEIFQFNKPTKTPPKDQQPDPMSDADRTPDLTCVSPAKKIKLEKFSHDIIDGDGNSRDSSSNSVIVIEENSEHPLTIIDSADANREMLDSLERRLENISEYADEEMNAEPAKPPFQQGTRYKDCEDCYKFYKEKSNKKEIVYELHNCRRQCSGYYSRVNEMKEEARKTKSMPPRKVYNDTPSGFWSLSFPKSDTL